jgi:hypothetical protein
MISISILALVAVLALIYTIAAKEQKTMATLTDVKASLATLQTTTDTVKAYVAQQAAPAATEADLDGIKAAIDAQNAELQGILPAAAPVTDDPVQAASDVSTGTENGAPVADLNAGGDGSQSAA